MEKTSEDSFSAENVDRQTLWCPNCGKEGSGKFCDQCGTPLQVDSPKPSKQKKKWVTLPKAIVIVVICLVICGFAYYLFHKNGIKISKKNFPDPLFRDYVREFDKNDDGYLSSKEIEKVYSITIDDMKIEDLTGIEYFTQVTSLDCKNCEIKTLDVSQNKKLRYIDCPNNNIEELVLPDYSAEDESELTHLDCSLNYISDLDLSEYENMEWLDCSYNDLSTLKIQSNTALKSLDCSYNDIQDLKLVSNTKLVWLSCDHNRLKKLDIHKATSLDYLVCNNNQITELDLSANEELTTAYCHNNKIENLTLGKKKELTTLSTEKNKIEVLDIQKCPVIQIIYETIPIETENGVLVWVYVSMETGPILFSVDKTTEIINGPITETIG